MEAIEKLRNLTTWLNCQSEHLNFRFKSISQMEKVYDYALKHNLDFVDDDYLYSECTQEERVNFYKFLDKIGFYKKP